MFNGSRKLVYRGRLDDSWKDPSLVQKQELRDAIETTLKGKIRPLSKTLNGVLNKMEINVERPN